MSYILDALKKAEAERTLGAVPNIHAQPLASASSANTATLWQRPWMWSALIALILAPAVAVWINPWRTAPATPAGAALPAPRPIASLPPVAAAPAPPLVVDAPPKAAPQKPVKPKSRTDLVRESKAGVAMQSHQKPAAAATPVRDEQTIAALRELPEQIQREIPQLSIDGYIYSGNRADRSVLINKRLLRDGDQVAPNLILEKMTPTGMIFNYKGYRYRTSY